MKIIDMKKSALLTTGVLALSFASLGAFSFIYQTPRLNFTSPAPHLELSTNRLELGEGKPNELLRGSLQLRNTGSGELEFEIVASCGCTELTPRRGTLSAGAEQSVGLAVQLHPYANSERNVQLVVKTNDPQKPQVSCLIVAKCPAPFRVEPAFIDFGKISRETTSVKPAEIHIAVAEGEHRRVCTRLSGEAFVIVSERPGLVQVTPSEGLEFGDHYGKLDLFFEGSEDWVMSVPLRIEVPPPLSAVPHTITLHKDSAGRFAPVYCILISNSKSAPLGEVRAVNAPSGFRIKAVDRIDEHRCRYRLTIKEGWEAPGRFRLELEDLSTRQHCGLLLLSSERK